ncbi:ATP-dependent RNA helicase [Thermoplasma volcanium GSS1]|uniref:ATP-dependent RNA helicase n=1 Tax=Thermoplasma volcanium (strain ATCC 51530 / DSM 4299 / JCM 9571 / NBRC 15438 / GSS1) TaxID=273116 RepID=Q978T9_THEVO|nr:DEAD/DEAH box helicase [Thermoplasma volcanium]BAB60468.1 ATP-dependent RNA helicase [Thermoplasma volcanium GSS1]
MKGFEEFNLRNELIESIRGTGYSEPTEVQSMAIPIALAGSDLVVRSKTGSGKTAAYLIPIINNTAKEKGIRALILLPTRELAVQVAKVSEALGKRSGIRTVVVYGGVSINKQIELILRGANIIVGTPGRTLDLIDRGILNFDKVSYFVLDEADEMLDMGFIEDIKKIINVLPVERQSFLFSATIPSEIIELAKGFMHNEEILFLSKDEVTVNGIDHNYAVSRRERKLRTLFSYIDKYKPEKSIIFSRTKAGANMIYEALINHGQDAVIMHGDLTQAQREKALYRFKNFGRFLVATNVAARGLDIGGISDIINYDVPDDPRVYVHRVGRTARMGAAGRAFTIVEDREIGSIDMIRHEARVKMKEIHLETTRKNF